MTTILSKSLLKVGLLSLIAVATVYASGITAPKRTDYKQMTTVELQKEVEKRSIEGTLPFSMGIELINRWSNPK